MKRSPQHGRSTGNENIRLNVVHRFAKGIVSKSDRRERWGGKVNKVILCVTISDGCCSLVYECRGLINAGARTRMRCPHGGQRERLAFDINM